MRRKPWALIVLAALHIIAPFGNIILNAIINDQNVLSYIVYALSPDYLSRNWIMIIAPIFAGVSIYLCKPWSFYGYLISISVLFFFNYTSYTSKAEALGLLPLLTVFLVNIAVVMFFLIPAVRNVYFDRRLRWWEIQSRYKCQFKCLWKLNHSEHLLTGKVSNISKNGLFINSDELPEDNSKVEIQLIHNGQTIELSGEVILHGGVDTLGFGVKLHHTAKSKREMKNIVANLKESGMQISPLKDRPEDSFTFWVRTLVTTGKGLLPKKEK